MMCLICQPTRSCKAFIELSVLALAQVLCKPGAVSNERTFIYSVFPHEVSLHLLG